MFVWALPDVVLDDEKDKGRWWKQLPSILKKGRMLFENSPMLFERGREGTSAVSSDEFVRAMPWRENGFWKGVVFDAWKRVGECLFWCPRARTRVMSFEEKMLDLSPFGDYSFGYQCYKGWQMRFYLSPFFVRFWVGDPSVYRRSCGFEVGSLISHPFGVDLSSFQWKTVTFFRGMKGGEVAKVGWKTKKVIERVTLSWEKGLVTDW